MAVYRQQVEESHHDLVNLLTQQMTTILNSIMADHDTRSRCYVILPESEIVKIAIMGLGFYMRRKLLNVHILDLGHLVEKFRQTELMKKEKEKHRSE
ncbi:hypothetical protein Ahy_A10g049131 [Arachis hypogaea]|uniref:Uncharacterized protein n=1 Tax=Arachis hypogaea TaxID=3818 RepID=A0A445B6N9_ARAHY|nr:hypothetical protein Ahy_A10g049131 [Arachis hypogaea]